MKIPTPDEADNALRKFGAAIEEKYKCDLFCIVHEFIDSHRWIPVSERLPDQGVDVLIYLPNGNYTALAHWYKRGVWNHHGKPSHWQPLPEPPRIDSSTQETQQ